MYESGTILTLKDQRPPDEETNEVFAYNEVEVIGPSPVTHPGTAEWSGTASQGVIIKPIANFGGVIDEPLGKIQALYNVKSIPVKEVVMQPKIKVIDSATAAAGPTPEEVFAKEAPGVPPEEGQIRGRTSPLEDPRPKVSDGPLGPVPEEDKEEPFIPKTNSPL